MPVRLPHKHVSQHDNRCQFRGKTRLNLAKNNDKNSDPVKKQGQIFNRAVFLNEFQHIGTGQYGPYNQSG